MYSLARLTCSVSCRRVLGSSLKYLADQNVESGATPLVKFRCCDICEKGKGQVDETDLTDEMSILINCLHELNGEHGIGAAIDWLR